MKLINRMRVIPVEDGKYFMLNGLNGAIDLLDNTGYQIYQKWKDQAAITPVGQEQTLFEGLQQRGYLVEDQNTELDLEKELFQRLEQKHQRHQKIIEPLIILTYDCNFRCPYCYEQTLMDKGKDWMNKQITPEMVHSLIRHFDNYKVERITLFGGEPLLPRNKETVIEFIKYIKAKNLKLNIITNGYYLEHYIPLLVDVDVQKIQITLDGNEERHNQTRYTAGKQGTFHKILENVKLARKDNLPIFIRCNVDIDDQNQVNDLLQTFDEYGLRDDPGIELFVAALREGEHLEGDNCNIIRKYIQQIDKAIDYPNSTKEMFVKLSHIATNFLDNTNWHPKYTYCFAHSSLQVFDPWGYIYPCSVLVGREKDIIGTYDENGVIFNDLYTKWHNRTVANMEKCRDCEMALFCGGGCAGESSYQNRDLYEPDCSDMEAYLSELLPYLYARYVKKQA